MTSFRPYQILFTAQVFSFGEEQMKRLTLTRELAHAAGWDAGMKSMRAHGRQQWNDEDYEAACQVMDRLWPDEYEQACFTPAMPEIVS